MSHFLSLRYVQEASAGRALHVVTDRLQPPLRAVLKEASGPKEAEALDRERRQLLELRHPSIRRVLHAGDFDGHAALVLEHVDGVTLDEHLASCPDDAHRCTVQLLRALLYLHERGRAHGDLKPANILVEPGAEVRLIDLGLSVPLGTPPAGGTRPFLAPELTRGAPASVASDLYALGITLREALGMEPASLAEVLDACTADEPTARPATAAAALALLGTGPRALDRLGEPPRVGGDEVLSQLRRALASFGGQTVVVRAGPGAGRTRILCSLRRDACRARRPIADASFAGGRDPLGRLHDLLRPGADEDRLERAAAIGAVAAARLGVSIVLDDVDQAGEDVRHALPSVARALSADGRGALILLGVDAALAASLGAAGATVTEVAPLSGSEVRTLVDSVGARADDAVLAALRRGSGGAPGAVARAAVRLLDDPALSPGEVERLARPRSPERPDDAAPAEGDPLALARVDLEERAARRAAARLRAAFAGIDESPGVHPQAARLLARAEAQAGNLSRSESLLAALPGASADDRLLRAQVLERLGRYEEARSVAEPLQDAAGVGPRAAVVGAGVCIRLGDHGAASAMVDRGLSGGPDTLTKVRLLLTASDLALASGDVPLAEARAADAARRLTDTPAADQRLVAEVRARQGMVCSMAGEPARARAHHEAALQAAQASGDPACLAPYVMNLATAEHAAGDLGQAIHHYEEASRLAELFGRDAIRAAALVNLGGLLAMVGAGAEAARLLADAQAAASRAGAAIYRAQATLISAEIAGAADRSRGRALARAAREEFLACGAARQALEAELLEVELFDGREDSERARTFCEQNERALADGGLAARAGVLLARCALASDEPGNGIASAERAVERAEADGERELMGRALGVLAAIHRRLGTGGDAAHRTRAREVLSSVAARLPSGLRERFLAEPTRAEIFREERVAGASATGLGPGGRRLLSLVRRVLLEGDERRLLEAAVDEAVELSRAERAFLLRRRPGSRARDEVIVARNLDGDSIRKNRAGFSRSVAEGVLSTGEPIVTAMATDDPSLAGARSILDLGLRSILCVPVRGPSGVTGALYLDHRFQSGQFGDEEREVVQALADIIGIALENARLHTEARERTAELLRANEAVSRESERRAMEVERLVERLQQREGTDPAGGIVGRAPALLSAIEVARRVAPSDLPVLITGESGTGKELLARYIHDQSARHRGPFLAINCGALPETLLESELFGHVRGAFTGATRDHPGLFRAAEGGTILLDEIGEMPPRMQTRLLRVLQEREVRPVGGPHPVPVNVRVLAATHRDLTEGTDAGRFRRDLYYRLVGVHIEVPPLRERQQDIPRLATEALRRIAAEPGMREMTLSRAALARMMSHDWPGNVRELEQALRRAVLVADGEEIAPGDLALGGAPVSRAAALRGFDRTLVEQALRASGGNRSAAARALGISRVTLHRWIRRYDL